MSKKLLTWIGLLVILSLLLGACGPAQTPEPVETTAPATETSGETGGSLILATTTSTDDFGLAGLHPAGF